jgi:hypothetical protein
MIAYRHPRDQCGGQTSLAQACQQSGPRRDGGEFSGDAALVGQDDRRQTRAVCDDPSTRDPVANAWATGPVAKNR